MNQAPPVPAAKKGMPTWLIVVLCTAGAFAILVPILVVLGVYGARKYIQNAKTAEARNALGQIAKDAVAAYDARTHFCSSARAPVPVDGAMVRGMRYQSAAADWGSSADHALHAGFPCLGFSLDQPQYYQYAYAAAAPGRESFEATARGDLDGNGVFSSFAIHGSAVGGTPSVDPAITEKDPQE